MKLHQINKSDITYNVINVYDEDLKVCDENSPQNRNEINSFNANSSNLQELEATKEERYNFVKKVQELRPEIRFQNWKVGKYQVLFNTIPSYAWHSNKEFLRYSIETPNITELIIDIDAKNEKGEKSLSKAVEIGTQIFDKLLSENITPSFYYGGGNGIHIHALLDISKLNFLENNEISINLNEYEREFRLKGQQKQVEGTPNKDLIDKRNEERRETKKLLCQYLGIKDLVDNQLFSTKEMITLEGYQKRDSKTGNYKIFIPRRYIHRKGEGGVLEYIEENKNKIILNKNYFREISPIHKEMREYIRKQYEQNLTERKKSSTNGNEFVQFSGRESSKRKTNDIKILQYLKTFASIYAKDNLSSTNQFYTIVITYLYSATRDKEKTKGFFNLLFSQFNCPDNLTCSREQKVESVVDNFHKGKTKIFFNNPYLTKERFKQELANLEGVGI